MKYDLSVRQRLLILELLPKEATLANMRVVHDLKMDVGIPEAEWEDLQIREDPQNNKLYWSPEQEAIAGLKSVEIGARGQELIREALAKADDEGRLREEQLEIVDLFEYEG